MKKNEWHYAVKAGFQGLRRHPLLSVAAITTLALMLFLMSTFFTLSMNANHLSIVASQQPPIEVTMQVSASNTEIENLARFLQNHEFIEDISINTPEDNFEKFKQDMGKEELWKDFNYLLYIPYTFSFRLTEPSYGPAVGEEIRVLPGVKEVLMESELMTMLDSVKRWTQRAGLIVFVILAVAASVVMANTTRIAALSRSREIHIMKYVGSTKAFIRTPFIVEGVVIGMLGALVASVTAILIYGRIVTRLNPAGAVFEESQFMLLPASKMAASVFLINLVTGIALTMIVSAISVRKYAKV
ncbi:MAG TPA: permease-like cell division protein FtsX [Bacillota bacterium]|nr:ABC transporter permease [Fastidiosipila sp.]HPX93304.1 permease-like cell division protein FtsX [Bacillota bacterium]HQB80963.1 permease-like cell division protein FtsX [Bacillota bacterium]